MFQEVLNEVKLRKLKIQASELCASRDSKERTLGKTLQLKIKLILKDSNKKQNGFL